MGKELRKELESPPAKRRGENGPSAQLWGTQAGAQGRLVCAQVCGNWQLAPGLAEHGRAGPGREPLCFVAEHGLSELYCRKAFPSAVSALSAGALLCQPPCFSHGACSPPQDLGGEAKQL